MTRAQFMQTSRVVAYAMHRRRSKTGTTLERVPIFAMRWVDPSKKYRGRLGFKDRLRQARARGETL